MFMANYFDGCNGTLHPVTLRLDRQYFHMDGENLSLRVPVCTSQLGEPFDGAPCVLYFADGGRCEVNLAADKRGLLDALGFRKTFVLRWQQRWYGALFALVGMVVALAVGYWWGVPWAADHASAYIPQSWEISLGNQALLGLDKNLFAPTTVSVEQQQLAQQIFRKIQPSVSRMPMRLVFRNAASVGPNAFALPNGTIVVTDAMISQITGEASTLEGGLADELAAVLAHEIGHVQSRHSLKNIVAHGVIGAAAWTLFGDFSGAAVGTSTFLVGLEFSRSAETEADDYAVGLLHQHGIRAARLADVLHALDRSGQRKGETPLPRWMRKATNYVSTHPATAARMQRLRDADLTWSGRDLRQGQPE